jgi:hypothetical protein
MLPVPVVLWLGDLESPRPKANPPFELARGRALESRRSLYVDLAGKLSRPEPNVLERPDGRREKRREGFPPASPELLVFLREKPNERRLDSVLFLGWAMASFDIGPAMEVGG